MTNTTVLIGISGASYQYYLYTANGGWFDLPGNYAFAKEISHGLLGPIWAFLYFGETDSFARRLPSHERWEEARHLGATHILAHVNHGGNLARKAEEADLIHAYNPPMNVQNTPSRPAPLAGGLFGLG